VNPSSPLWRLMICFCDDRAACHLLYNVYVLCQRALHYNAKGRGSAESHPLCCVKGRCSAVLY
jgi:hypothetical protein